MKHYLPLLVLFYLLTPQWCVFNLNSADLSVQSPVKRISLRIEAETSLLISQYVVVAADNRLSLERERCNIAERCRSDNRWGKGGG